MREEEIMSRCNLIDRMDLEVYQIIESHFSTNYLRMRRLFLNVSRKDLKMKRREGKGHMVIYLPFTHFVRNGL
jgi:hypothetical protein